MNSTWFVTCRDVAGRPRALRVLTSGPEVVVVAPPGESAYLDDEEAERFLSAFAEARTAAASSNGSTPWHGVASPAERDGVPPTVVGRPALLPCRGGTTPSPAGPTATPLAERRTA